MGVAKNYRKHTCLGVTSHQLFLFSLCQMKPTHPISMSPTQLPQQPTSSYRNHYKLCSS